MGRAVVLASIIGLAVAAPSQGALRAPGLQAPAAAASVEALPTFTWRAVKGAGQYEFQLAADSRFNSIVLGKGRGLGSQRTRNTAASLHKTVPDGTYYWRVRAISKSEKAGRWSAGRKLVKAWQTAPRLLAPSDEFSVTWPDSPLSLRWEPVPHATHYLVTIATDPTLAQSVIDVRNKPVETQGTVFALQGTLPAGRYYWAITPVDAGGLRGTRSRVGSFTWQWPTATATNVIDLNDSDRVFDPLLTWNLVPGAARYEVEINPDDDFAAGSRVCCKDRVIGTSVSPLRLLPNNNDLGASGYNWRVRAFDVDDNPGQWNVGPTFAKNYDDVAETIPNLRLRDPLLTELAPSAATVTGSPVITWDPVPGAARYQVQWTAYSGGICQWSSPTELSGAIKTSATAWTPLSPAPAPFHTAVPGGIGITSSLRPNGTGARSGQPFSPERAYPLPPVKGFVDGATYCVRARALSDDSYRENDGATSEIPSRWMQLGGSDNQPAFTYQAPGSGGTSGNLSAPTYLAPGNGSQVTRTPLLRWSPVPEALRYFVIIARDSNFTNVIDAAFTSMTAYQPNIALEDETTSYFWAVVPARRSDGGGISNGPMSYSPQTFQKMTTGPGLLTPAKDEDVSVQPTFRWTPTEAAQKYRIQVSSDPQFGNLIDDVVTASTAYTSQTPYPADTVLYWRVRGEQHQALQAPNERVELRWSATGSFRRRLPAPVPAAGNPLSGELVPLLSWTPVPAAVSYDLHIDEADGDANDFTVKSPAAAFTKFFGIGIFKYKIRANFAARSGTVASGYSEQRAFTRLISPPPGARMTRSGSRLIFAWEPAAAAASYKVEVSTTDSFARVMDAVKTDNTSWAPDLTQAGYRGRSPLYWRVATVDEGNNVGAWATNAPPGKRLTVRVSGTLRRGRTSRITVSVRGSGKLVKGAAVRASGAGVRSTTKRTGRRGTASMTLRPKTKGSVTLRISRSGYITKSVILRVR